MGRFMKLGCLGILVAVGLLVVIVIAAPKGASQQTVSGQAAAKPGAPAELPGLGQTASRGGWAVTFNEYGPYEQFAPRPPSTPAQGKLVVVDFTAKNNQDRTSNFTTNDFAIQSGDGRKFAPASSSIGSGIERTFFISQQVQPGLAATNRLVFDIDPAATNLTLTALGMQFKIPE